jgi:hypothetical protein
MKKMVKAKVEEPNAKSSDAATRSEDLSSEPGSSLLRSLRLLQE